jgi:eukaryotic-like serine/threonine-protein kinase
MQHNRQVVVVMFSDVVGYTKLMGTDEAATLALVQQSQRIQKDLIAKNHGRFVKEIGDGLLAYFENPSEAVRCCYEIQLNHTQLALNIRIGLHVADTIIEANDIYGDGVNIAARIESLADPGGVFISEDLLKVVQLMEDIYAVPMGTARLKNVKMPVVIYALQGGSLPMPNKRRFQELANPRKKLAAVPTLVVFLLILSAIIFYAVQYKNRREKVEEARNSLPEIQRLVESSWRDYSQAYDLAMKAKQWIPDDSLLNELIDRTSLEIDVNTEPQGATVYIKKYSDPSAPWQKIGVTPIQSVRLPVSIFRWKIEKEGYETLLGAATTFDFKDFADMRKVNLFTANNFFRRLDPVGTIPPQMTRVTGFEMPYGKLDDFFVDKYEVTNSDYKRFVEAGGYNRAIWWTEPFTDGDKIISFENAMKLFVDKTGLPGPSTWANGTYPKGQEDFPVSGVSWFEAMAYAKFSGKALPTGDHWGLARGENTFLIRWPQMGGYAVFAPFSNFNHKGAVRVGSLNGITAYGAHDMAGNVQEWCVNNSPEGRLVRGGSWKSTTYMFSHPLQAPPFDRSETNGFRCAVYPDSAALPSSAYRLIRTMAQDQNPASQADVPDQVFEAYKAFYEYDRTELNKEQHAVDNSHPDWIHEKVSINAAYGDERIILHIFLPRNYPPPYQAVLYGPGSASLYQLTSDQITDYYEFPVFLDFIVKSGRAVIYPVIQGTFERRKDATSVIHTGNETLQYAEFLIQIIKDYRRTVDYLVTRDDMDEEKLSFYGLSWGPIIGTILSAVDDRIKVNVFVSGGLRRVGRPEVNQSSFMTRVKVPTLMINGRFDSLMPLDLNIEPLYNGLGTSREMKRLALFDTDHIPPRENMIVETLAWLDQYLGPVSLAKPSLAIR